MSSWANRTAVPRKQKEPPQHRYFSPSEDFFSSTLSFLGWTVYHQRSAEPFYIYDPRGSLQPLLQRNPTLHFVKEEPTGVRLSTLSSEVQGVFQTIPISTLKRLVAATYQLNAETQGRISMLLSTFGLANRKFDAGIVLDVSGCVPKVIQALKQVQTRLGKKTLTVFVCTDNLSLLQEFAQKGDVSWNYMSLNRNVASRSPDAALLKSLAELQILRETETLVLRLGSPLGKLLSLLHSSASGFLISWDGSSSTPLV